MSDDVLDLLKTAPEPPMSVDVYAAMAAGRRAQTHRRRVVTVAVAAAILVIATGSMLVGGHTEALPARPSPTNPGPSTTPSATPRSLTAQLGLPGGTLTARLDPPTATITVRHAGESQSSPGFPVPVPSSTGAASCRLSPTLQVLVCAVRAPVHQGILTYTDPANLAATPSPPLAGRFSVPDVSVVVVWASAADLPSVRGAVWDLDDGTVADSFGAPVPQAHARTAPVQVFASAREGSFFLGLRPDSQDGWVGSGPYDFAGRAPRTGMGDDTGDYYAYVLPATAVSGDVSPPADATVLSQEVLDLGSRKVLVAHLTGVVRHRSPSAHWVDEDGKVNPLR